MFVDSIRSKNDLGEKQDKKAWDYHDWNILPSGSANTLGSVLVL